jgi:hypothetical protein
VIKDIEQFTLIVFAIFNSEFLEEQKMLKNAEGASSKYFLIAKCLKYKKRHHHHQQKKNQIMIRLFNQLPVILRI